MANANMVAVSNDNGCESTFTAYKAVSFYATKSSDVSMAVSGQVSQSKADQMTLSRSSVNRREMGLMNSIGYLCKSGVYFVTCGRKICFNPI